MHFEELKIEMEGFFTSEQRTFMVEKYIETRNTDEVINLFQRRFPNRNPPSTRTVFYNVRKYRQRATSNNCHKQNSGRRRTGRTEENVNLVHAALQKNPNLSVRRKNTGISPVTFNRIVRLDLRWHP